jgi:mannose-6-phosphate isomerase-like protein (cupin superfamily)
VHRLLIKPHAQCSLHCHAHKWNAFYVKTGSLKIEVHKNDYALVDVTELEEGEFTTVKPGEYHRFISDEFEVEALELYYPQELAEDIVRKDCGSLLTEPTHGN